MKPRLTHARRRALSAAGFVLIELVVAIGILSAVMLPLAFSLVQEQRLARAYYFRAVAMEIVDGEMETLLAGGWKQFPNGRQSYSVRADAATNLPPGQFVLTLEKARIQLEWRPVKRGKGGAVTRAASLQHQERP